MLKRLIGATLLEIMLVLAIATSILLMGLRWFQTMQVQNNYTILKSDVDQLLLALRHYYQANCDVKTSPFYPTTPIRSVLPIDLTTDLQNYLATNWPRNTPVVEISESDTGEVDNGYHAQFNLYSPGGANLPQKSAFVCFQFDSTQPSQCAQSVTLTNSKLYIWQIQVVVKMKNPEEAFYYRQVAGADCIAATYDPDLPIDCAANLADPDLTEADYLVWQRMPAAVAPTVRSSLWMMDPIVRGFKMQYTNDPMYEMSDPNTNQNYLCGGG